VGLLAAALHLHAGCRRGPDAETRRRAATLAEALRPPFFVAALRRMGGGHFHGTARFAAGPEAPSDAVTTTTDAWLDRTGNYRMRELNDRDGGREVVLYGRELSVALRYGKMIRRAAEEPEPTRLLEEGLGAPWAAWELMAPDAAIERVGTQLVGGAKATEYRLSRARGARTEPAEPAAGDRPYAGLRAWRGTATTGNLTGRVLVDDATGAVMQADLSATFSLKNEGRVVQGALDVHTALTDVASPVAVERPPGEDLALRQRTVPEQRELLGGLPTTRAVPDAVARPKPKPKAKTK
jgi:hypothetical protein